MAYAVVRTDNLTGTFDGSKLRSVIFHDSDPAAIENGNIVLLDSRMTAGTQRDVWKAVKPESAFVAGKIALIASPEVMYDERKKNLEDFRNEAGEIARAYILEDGDEFSVTAEALNGVPTVGAKIGVGADTKLQSGAEGLGVCTGIEVVGSKTFYVISVATAKSAE